MIAKKDQYARELPLEVLECVLQGISTASLHLLEILRHFPLEMNHHL